jgi:hypothetical protein
MAQESSTTLQTLAAANARHLIYSGEFLWTSGLVLHPLALGMGVGSWTDETSYIVEMRGDMQAIGWQHGLGAVGHGVSNVVYVTFDNTTNRFSIESDSGLFSDIYGPFQKRGRVQVGFYDSDSTAHTTQQITGYIVGAKEDAAQGRTTVEIRDRGAILVHEKGNTALYQNQGAGQYIRNIATVLMGGGDDYAIDRFPTPGIFTIGSSSDPTIDTIVYSPGMIPIPYCWVDDESYWEEMSLCAESQLGRVYFDKMGTLHFEDGTHWVTPRNVSRINPLTSQYTFTTSDYGACNVQVDYSSLYNDIAVEYWERYESVEQIIWEADGVQVIPPKSTETITAYFRYPVISTETLLQGTDYDAVNASGADLNSSCTISVDVYAHRAIFSVQNTSASGMFLTGLQLRGHPALPYQSDRYQCEDETSINTFGRRTWKVTNPYVQGYRHAEMIGEFLLNRFKDPLTYVRLTGCRGIPWLEVGDRVTVQADNLATASEDYYIVRMGWTFGPNRAYSMDLDLLKCTDVFTTPLNYFQIGTSYYNGADVLFW